MQFYTCKAILIVVERSNIQLNKRQRSPANGQNEENDYGDETNDQNPTGCSFG